MSGNASDLTKRCPDYLRHYPWGVVANHLIDTVGFDLAMTLMLELGGTRQRVPLRAEGSLIARVIGEDAARELSQKYSNERWTIPCSTEVVAQWLFRDRGYSQEQICMRLHRGRSTIQAYLNRDYSRPERGARETRFQ